MSTRARGDEARQRWLNGQRAERRDARAESHRLSGLEAKRVTDVLEAGYDVARQAAYWLAPGAKDPYARLDGLRTALYGLHRLSLEAALTLDVFMRHREIERDGELAPFDPVRDELAEARRRHGSTR